MFIKKIGKAKFRLTIIIVFVKKLRSSDLKKIKTNYHVN
jgi:hypothetical protein